MRLQTSDILTLAAPLGLAVLGLGLGLVARRTILGRLARLAARTRTEADDLMVAAFRGPVVLWGLILGLYVAAEVATLPAATAHLVQRVLVVLLIASVTWALAGLAGGVVRSQTTTEHGPLPSATLLSNITKGIVLVTGLLVILDTLGIRITPIITALGVGGLAVALALQDTLANLFAGVFLLASRQVRPGDFVELGSGEKGYVQDVTWRFTTIRQLPNNITVVPNSKLASAVTTNYYLPEREMSVLVQVGVAYDSDLRQVERITVEVGKAVLREVQGGVAEFEPFIRYHTFGDFAIQFSVILRAREFTDQYLITHEFIKRLHERYRQEGIEIPFPIRTVELRGGAAAAMGA
jgi:small-conductance mechanosensitive channel